VQNWTTSLARACAWAKTLHFVGRLRGKLPGEGFVSSALGSALVRIGAAVLMLANTVALSRLLGTESFGVYSLAGVAVAFLALPLNSSLSTLALREAAASRELERWESLKGVVCFALVAIPIYSGSVALVAMAALRLYPWHVDPAVLATLTLGLLLLPFHAAGEIIGAILRALRRVVTGQLPDQILKHVFLLMMLLVAFVAWGPEWLTPLRAMGIFIVAAALATVVALIMLFRALPPALWHSSIRFPLRNWLRTLLPLTVLAIMQAMNMYTDVLLLGLLASPADVGVYRVAAQCSQMVAFSLLAIHPAVSTYVARLHARGDHAAVQRIVTWTARGVLAAALPVCLALMLFGRPVLGYLFGPVYEQGAPALAVLAAGQIANASTGAVGLILNMTGNERDAIVGLAAAAISSVILNLILIPPLGLVGAAIATATSVVIWNAVLVQRLKLRTGLVSFAFPLRP
jgi:O-antigen/teichoic acid export membrane protein